MFGWNQKFQIALVHRCYRPEYGFESPAQTSVRVFMQKMSNSELTDNASAAMPTSRMKALGKYVSFYILLFNSRRLIPTFSLLRLRPCPLSLFRTV